MKIERDIFPFFNFIYLRNVKILHTVIILGFLSDISFWIYSFYEKDIYYNFIYNYMYLIVFCMS